MYNTFSTAFRRELDNLSKEAEKKDRKEKDGATGDRLRYAKALSTAGAVTCLTSGAFSHFSDWNKRKKEWSTATPAEQGLSKSDFKALKTSGRSFRAPKMIQRALGRAALGAVSGGLAGLGIDAIRARFSGRKKETK